MSKTITQERIYEVLDQVYAHHFYTPRARQLNDLITLGMQHGLKKRVGASDEISQQKVELEATYAGFDITDPLAAKKILAEWHAIGDRFRARRDRVLAIQERYGVSGLTRELIEVGQHSFDYLYPDNDLRMTPQDYETLRSRKQQTLEFWLTVVKSEDFAIYYRTGEDWYRGEYWRRCNSDRVLAFSPLADWIGLYLDTSLPELPHLHLSLNKLGKDESWGSFVAVPESCEYPTIG